MLVLDLARIDAEMLAEQPPEHGGVALAGRLHVAAEDQFVFAGKSDRSRLRR
jgi:hypothetical protein